MRRTAKEIQGRSYVSPRTFFDEDSHEFTKKPFNYKTERLTEYVKSGYSLRRWIIEYKNYYNDGNHEHMKGYLERALNTYIHYFKTGEIKFFYDKNPYSSNLDELIKLLETEIRNTLTKQHMKFNETEMRALINSYLFNKFDYEISTKELNINFNDNITDKLEARDKAEGLEEPNSYQHLKSLLLNNIFFAIRENNYSQLSPQMGCSKNQLQYLNLFAEKTKDKTNSYKKEVAIEIALQLIKVIYFN
jgi:hypothetical protein